MVSIKTKVLSVIVILFCMLTSASAQGGQTIDTNKVYTAIEKMAEFPGGEAALMKYLRDCPYPQAALDSALQGSVFVAFVVGRDGKVSDAVIQKGNHEILNEAALEHVRKMPLWTPAQQNRQNVKMQYVVPVRFVLPTDPEKK